MARATLVAMLACGPAMTAVVPTRAQTVPPTTPPPVPRPFPGSAPPPAQATPPGQTVVPPAESAPPQLGAPSEATLGVKSYPGAEFLESFNAGGGQRLYLFGMNATYAEVVAFYKGELRTNGKELFKTPAMQQFDLDKFVEEKMAYPPSVVVKDYTWAGLSGGLKDGYLFIDGTAEKRFKTIVQIVPAPIK
jgi:hypothetical protein